MSKNLRNTIIAVCVAVIMGLTYIIVFKYTAASDSMNYNTNAGEIEISVDEIDEVDVQNANGKYVVKDHRVNDSADSDPEAISELLQSVSEIRFLRKVEINTDECGLASPAASITLRLKNGNMIDLYAGDSTPLGDGYYIMHNGMIYILDESEAKVFFYAADHYRKRIIATIDRDSINRIEIYKNEKCIAKIESADTLSGYRMTEPYQAETSEVFAKFIARLPNSIKAVDITEDTAGYEVGKSRIIIADGCGVHNISIGSVNDDGMVYAAYEGYPFVFTLDAELSQMVDEFVPFDNISKLIRIVNINDVSSVIYSSPTEKLELEIKDGAYFINDKPAKENEFKEKYRSIMGVLISGEYNGKALGEKIGFISYLLKTGEVISEEFYQYDERSYVVKTDTGALFRVLKDNFDEVFSKE